MEAILIALMAVGLLGGLISSSEPDEDDADRLHSDTEDGFGNAISDSQAGNYADQSQLDSEDGFDNAITDSEAGSNAMPGPVSPLATQETGLTKNAASATSLRLLDLDSVDWTNPSSVKFIEGTEGDDFVVVGSEPSSIAMSSGADVTDASLARMSLIEAGQEDIVYSSDVHTDNVLDNIVVGRDGATILGGDGNNTVVSIGQTGSRAFMGEGDDLLISDSGESYLEGEAGDDTLYGQGETVFSFAEVSRTDQMIDKNSDTLIGGEGDDLVFLSGKDHAEGNEGSDEFFVYGNNNAIGDFDETEDRLVVVLDDSEFLASANLLERVTLDKEDGGVSLFIDGQPIVYLDKIEELSVGIYNSDHVVDGIIDTPGSLGEPALYIVPLSVGY